MVFRLRQVSSSPPGRRCRPRWAAWNPAPPAAAARWAKAIGGAVHQFRAGEPAAVQYVLAARAAAASAACRFPAGRRSEVCASTWTWAWYPASVSSRLRSSRAAVSSGAASTAARRRGRRELAERRQHGVHLQNVVIRSAGAAATRRTLSPWCCRRGRFPPPGRLLPRRRAVRAGRSRSSRTGGARSVTSPTGCALAGRRISSFTGRWIGAENPGVVHLREIVIFGGQPEHGDRRKCRWRSASAPVSRRAALCRWCRPVPRTTQPAAP